MKHDAPYCANGKPYVSIHKDIRKKDKAFCSDGNIRFSVIVCIAFIHSILYLITVCYFFYQFYLPPYRLRNSHKQPQTQRQKGNKC